MQDPALAEILGNIKALVAHMPTVIDGELTLERVSELQIFLSGRVDQGDNRFDLSGVQMIDGAGVQLLLALDASLSAAGRQIELVDVPPCVSEALAVCGLDNQLRSLPEYWT
ncbi:STAS domain-containing protein [Derxia gummosa]|uniref:STAS domain-containing protein n=1 Tax=Derxia gummosa DSM 723 TaxID=1121388 RepID=A0A8B6X8G5_9BURK|nr:STAS domain-containing protein [Derxia gummosa]